MKTDNEPSSRHPRFDHLTFQYQLNPFTLWVGHSELSALRNMLPLPDQPGATRALDFGCGTGRAARVMSNAGYQVTGYDPSSNMLARARRVTRDPSISFTSNLDSIHQQYDLIVVLGVLDYYPDSRALWEEWKKILSPDGFLIVTVPNARSPLARIYVLLSRFTYPACVTPDEKLIFTASSAGFSPVQTEYAFPSRWWGHTVLFKFRYPASLVSTVWSPPS